MRGLYTCNVCVYVCNVPCLCIMYHVCVYTHTYSLSLGAATLLTATNIYNTHILVSTYHSPLKGTKTPWKNS